MVAIMRKLFTERMSPPLPRVSEKLNESVRLAVLELVQARIDDNSFGNGFPDQCPDGYANSGVNVRALSANMAAYRVISPNDSRPRMDVITDSEVFDLLEYSYEHIALPLPGNFHSYFGHFHYDYDVDKGRKQFSDEVNRLFERNGIAFELKDGQIERLVPSILEESLMQPTFNTGDHALDDLLTSAREKFLNRNIVVRREALEKLWDAWERLKSLRDPSDKKNSVKLLLDRAATEPNFRQRIDIEAKELTDIGNNFFIRHTEVSKPQIADSIQVDYLFHRLFCMIRMILQAHTVAI